MTVTRIRGAGKDKYGDPETATGARLDLHGCEVAPRVGIPGSSSNEIHKHGRDGLTQGLTLYVPDPTADVVFTDKIEHAGHVWDIEGDPGVWGTAGIEVQLRRTAG